MAEETPKPAPDRNTQLAEQRTDLALQRTRIAEERTLQAWIRTALSMIGFGFTIYKFVHELQRNLPPGEVARPESARNLGLALIALGTIAVAAAMFQHWQFLDALGIKPLRRPISLAFVMAFFVGLLGALAFIGVYFKAGPF